VARYGAALNSGLGPIDFAALAESLGAVGTRATTARQLGRALQLGLAQARPVVIHVPICGGTPTAA
jgi:thiamine pyrophosphate-dependent acetolactate synthase large subunit-like protein